MISRFNVYFYTPLQHKNSAWQVYIIAPCTHSFEKSCVIHQAHYDIFSAHTGTWKVYIWQLYIITHTPVCITCKFVLHIHTLGKYYALHASLF